MFNKHNLFLTIALLLLILSSLFLFFLQKDTLYDYAPGQAQSYWHSNADFINALSDKQKNLLFNYLSSHSGISEQTLRNTFGLTKGEIAAFDINNQYFFIVEDISGNQKALTSQKISFQKNKRALIWPMASLDIGSIAEQAWFQQIHHKINFNKFSGYLRNLNVINWPPAMTNSQLPITISSNDGKNFILNGEVGQLKSNGKPQISSLSKDNSLYFRGIYTNNLNYASKSLEYTILQSLTGPVEFVQNNDSSFLIYASNKNSVSLIQDVVSEFLGNMFPKKLIKALPDKTTALHLIENKEAFKFQELQENKQTKYVLFDDFCDINMQIQEKNDLIEISDSYTAAPDREISEIYKNCTKLNKKQLLIYKMTDNAFNNLIISIINPKKIAVCID